MSFAQILLQYVRYTGVKNAFHDIFVIELPGRFEKEDRREAAVPALTMAFTPPPCLQYFSYALRHAPAFGVPRVMPCYRGSHFDAPNAR